MYEDMTYDFILQEVLNNIPDDIDKREGSVIYNAIAPFAVEMAKMYIELDYLQQISFLGTTSESWLDLKGEEYGLTRYASTTAIRRGSFIDNTDLPLDVNIGSRFSIEDLNYVVIEKIEDGIFNLECEKAGTVGNKYYGRLFPIGSIPNLKEGTLGEVVKAGTDTETDEAYRERIIQYVQFKPYSGNRADYTRLIEEFGGFAGHKYERRQDEEENVYVYVLDEDYNVPTDEQIDTLQTYLNPVPNNGDGIGQIGIDHKTIVYKAIDELIDIEINISTLDGYSIETLRDEILKSIDDYFTNVKLDFQDLNDALIIKIAFLESNILEIDGISDIRDTKLNNLYANYICGYYSIPAVGEVIINEL